MKNITISLLGFFLSALPAMAESEHAHGAHEVNLVWPWVNFLIYCGILWYFLRVPIAEMWASRREFLANLKEKGALELKTAQSKLREAQDKIINAEKEAKELELSIIKDGEREGAQVVADAKSRAERILKQAEGSVSAERRSAEVLMRRELAEKVIQKTTEKIKRDLNADADRNNRKSVIGGVRQLVQ